MSIQKHRAAIDKLDAQIVKLLNRRTKHVLGMDSEYHGQYSYIRAGQNPVRVYLRLTDVHGHVMDRILA